MPVTLIQLRTREKVDYGVTAGTSTINRSYRTLMRRIVNEMRSAIAGSAGDGDFSFKYDPAEVAHANAGLAISGGSGAVGATLNLVPTTVAWATSDTVAAGLIAYAIASSAAAKVKGMFVANNLTAAITLGTLTAGQYVDICGTRFVATNGPPAQAGIWPTANTFDVSGGSASGAAALAAAVNISPKLSRSVFAISIASVVRFFARRATWNPSTLTWSWPSGSRQPSNILSTGNVLAPGAFVGIQSVDGGVIGNIHTIAASGTGVTVLNAETSLNRGAALDNGAIIGEA
jgi:hypothetical protein